MILEALVAFGALALVVGFKGWLIHQRIQAAKQRKETASGSGTAQFQRR
ncbi:MAG: hypothetical protein OXF26_06425 [Alphaproteobacteria bacterium]|nr:hypothetical protein [Alphaproteobacteria bacterium]MCY4319985.1 hypothetical protein [Alphaproteobacteria bacterium]